jgi:hypothetical protein
LKELRPVPWWVEAQWQPQQPQSWRWHINGQKCAPEIGTCLVPAGNLFQFANWKMAMEIVDLPSYNMVIFHGFLYGYQKVCWWPRGCGPMVSNELTWVCAGSMLGWNKPSRMLKATGKGTGLPTSGISIEPNLEPAVHWSQIALVVGCYPQTLAYSIKQKLRYKATLRQSFLSAPAASWSLIGLRSGYPRRNPQLLRCFLSDARHQERTKHPRVNGQTGTNGDKPNWCIKGSMGSCDVCSVCSCAFSLPSSMNVLWIHSFKLKLWSLVSSARLWKQTVVLLETNEGGELWRSQEHIDQDEVRSGRLGATGSKTSVWPGFENWWRKSCRIPWKIPFFEGNIGRPNWELRELPCESFFRCSQLQVTQPLYWIESELKGIFTWLSLNATLTWKSTSSKFYVFFFNFGRQHVMTHFLQMFSKAGSISTSEVSHRRACRWWIHSAEDRRRIPVSEYQVVETHWWSINDL